MNNYYIKPYDAGYEAPVTQYLMSRPGVLEMEEESVGTAAGVDCIEAPIHITLRLEMRLAFYEAPITLERIHNGQSAGVTALYQPGNVLLDGSQNLKPISKVRAVDFVYQGQGTYVDAHDQTRPFYSGHGLRRLIQLSPGQVVFQKPFAGRDTNVRLETTFKRADRDEWTEVTGFGRDTYPLYPYGGYVPLYGDLREIEPVYAFVGMDRLSGTPVTALKLYRSSFFHAGGGFPPTPFRQDHKNWVFPQSVSPLEQMTVGQALAEGRLTFTVKDEAGDEYLYQSYGYDQPGGVMTQVNVHCIANLL